MVQNTLIPITQYTESNVMNHIHEIQICVMWHKAMVYQSNK